MGDWRVKYQDKGRMKLEMEKQRGGSTVEGGKSLQKEKKGENNNNAV